MSAKEHFIDEVSDAILSLVQEAQADTYTHSDLTGAALAIAMTAWQRATGAAR